MQPPECLFPFPVVHCAGRVLAGARRPRAESGSSRRVEPNAVRSRTQIACLCRRGVPDCCRFSYAIPTSCASTRSSASARSPILRSRRCKWPRCCARPATRWRSSTRCWPPASRTTRPSCDAARPQVVVFYEDNYNFLSKMCLGKMRGACCEMIARARSARCPRRRRGLRCLGRARPLSRGRRRRRVARRGARGADGARGPARRTTSRCRFRGSSRDCPTSARRSTGRRRDRARRLRCPSPSCQSVPLATSSTSSAIEPYGAARTATSASTWPHRAVARSAATGARSRSGAIATCSERPTTSRPKCCTSNASTRPTMSGLPTTSSASAWIGSRDFAAAARGRRRRRAVHDPASRGLGEPEHGRGAPRSGLPRGLDRRRERQPEDSRCHAQGHARHRDRAGASACSAPRASASASS